MVVYDLNALYSKVLYSIANTKVQFPIFVSKLDHKIKIQLYIYYANYNLKGEILYKGHIKGNPKYKEVFCAVGI